MRPGTRPPTCTCWSSWSASACSCTPGKTRGRSCASSLCLPPAPQSPTSTTACRRSVCGSSWRCTLCPGSSSSRARRRASSSPWNETRALSSCPPSRSPLTQSYPSHRLPKRTLPWSIGVVKLTPCRPLWGALLVWSSPTGLVLYHKRAPVRT